MASINAQREPHVQDAATDTTGYEWVGTAETYAEAMRIADRLLGDGSLMERLFVWGTAWVGGRQGAVIGVFARYRKPATPPDLPGDEWREVGS